jgi:hypothetical protein
MNLISETFLKKCQKMALAQKKVTGIKTQIRLFLSERKKIS